MRLRAPLGLVFGGSVFLALAGGSAAGAPATRQHWCGTVAPAATSDRPWDGKPDHLALSRAKTLFQRYVELAAAFDPAQADLFHPSARILHRRTSHTGGAQVLSSTLAEMKVVLKHVMPIAKARNDRHDYSNVTYWAEGERVRIRATRYSLLRKVASSLALLVGPDSSGVWWIYEDLSE